MKHEANAPSYAPTRARYRTLLDQRVVTLKVEDNARLPASLDLGDRNLMVGHGLDLCIDGMEVWVEGFAGHCGCQVRRRQCRKVKSTT